jgi:DNA-binding transcriptional regulator GbsR (MarR family)
VDQWRSESLVAETIGELMNLWGFKRNMGRLWATLYLSNRPLPATELCARLELSSGAVSMTVTELGAWGVVRKVAIEGDRRTHYEAEGDLWRMVSRVLEQRERVAILDAIDAFESALEFAQARADHGTDDERTLAALQVDRIGELLGAARLGKDLVEHLLKRRQVDVSPLVQVLLGKGKS